MHSQTDATPLPISRSIQRTRGIYGSHNSQTITKKTGKTCPVELKLNIIKYKGPEDKQILRILRKEDRNPVKDVTKSQKIKITEEHLDNLGTTDTQVQETEKRAYKAIMKEVNHKLRQLMGSPETFTQEQTEKMMLNIRTRYTINDSEDRYMEDTNSKTSKPTIRHTIQATFIMLSLDHATCIQEMVTESKWCTLQMKEEHDLAEALQSLTSKTPMRLAGIPITTDIPDTTKAFIAQDNQACKIAIAREDIQKGMPIDDLKLTSTETIYQPRKHTGRSYARINQKVYIGHTSRAGIGWYIALDTEDTNCIKTSDGIITASKAIQRNEKLVMSTEPPEETICSIMEQPEGGGEGNVEEVEEVDSIIQEITNMKQDTAEECLTILETFKTKLARQNSTGCHKQIYKNTDIYKTIMSAAISVEERASTARDGEQDNMTSCRLEFGNVFTESRLMTITWSRESMEKCKDKPAIQSNIRIQYSIDNQTHAFNGVTRAEQTTAPDSIAFEVHVKQTERTKHLEANNNFLLITKGTAGVKHRNTAGDRQRIALHKITESSEKPHRPAIMELAKTIKNGTANTLIAIRNDSEAILKQKAISAGHKEEWNETRPKHWPSLNEKQLEAYMATTQHRYSAIIGPPGCGKTRMACEIAIRTALIYSQLLKEKTIQLLKNTTPRVQKKVVVIAPTNTTTQDLTIALKRATKGLGAEKKVGIVWIVSRAHTPNIIEGQEAYQETLEAKVLEGSPSENSLNNRDKNKLKELEKERKNTGFKNNKVQETTYNELLRKAKEAVVTEADIIICTTQTASNKLIQNQTVGHLIIDEAGMITEMDILIPLSLIPEKVTFIGDEKQLQPTYCSKTIENLGMKSLFRRIVHSDTINTIQLEEQMRGPMITMQVSSREFYKDSLRARDGLDDLRKKENEKIGIWRDANTPIAFIDVVNGKSERAKNSTSSSNREEANTCIDLTEQLVKRGVNTTDIAILTPYRAQTRRLHQLIEKRPYLTSVHVGTIDTAQGLEYKFVIISTVKTGAIHAKGFSNDPNRVNVAMTRARNGWILIGNQQTLQKSTLWRQFIDLTIQGGISQEAMQGITTQLENKDTPTDTIHCIDSPCTTDNILTGQKMENCIWRIRRRLSPLSPYRKFQEPTLESNLEIRDDNWLISTKKIHKKDHIIHAIIPHHTEENIGSAHSERGETEHTGAWHDKEWYYDWTSPQALHPLLATIKKPSSNTILERQESKRCNATVHTERTSRDGYLKVTIIAAEDIAINKPIICKLEEISNKTNSRTRGDITDSEDEDPRKGDFTDSEDEDPWDDHHDHTNPWSPSQGKDDSQNHDNNPVSKHTQKEGEGKGEKEEGYWRQQESDQKETGLKNKQQGRSIKTMEDIEQFGERKKKETNLKRLREKQRYEDTYELNMDAEVNNISQEPKEEERILTTGQKTERAKRNTRRILDRTNKRLMEHDNNALQNNLENEISLNNLNSMTFRIHTEALYIASGGYQPIRPRFSFYHRESSKEPAGITLNCLQEEILQHMDRTKLLKATNMLKSLQIIQRYYTEGCIRETEQEKNRRDKDIKSHQGDNEEIQGLRNLDMKVKTTIYALYKSTITQAQPQPASNKRYTLYSPNEALRAPEIRLKAKIMATAMAFTSIENIYATRAAIFYGSAGNRSAKMSTARDPDNRPLLRSHRKDKLDDRKIWKPEGYREAHGDIIEKRQGIGIPKQITDIIFYNQGENVRRATKKPTAMQELEPLAKKIYYCHSNRDTNWNNIIKRYVTWKPSIRSPRNTMDDMEKKLTIGTMVGLNRGMETHSKQYEYLDRQFDKANSIQQRNTLAKQVNNIQKEMLEAQERLLNIHIVLRARRANKGIYRQLGFKSNPIEQEEEEVLEETQTACQIAYNKTYTELEQWTYEDNPEEAKIKREEHKKLMRKYLEEDRKAKGQAENIMITKIRAIMPGLKQRLLFKITYDKPDHAREDTQKSQRRREYMAEIDNQMQEIAQPMYFEQADTQITTRHPNKDALTWNENTHRKKIKGATTGRPYNPHNQQQDDTEDIIHIDIERREYDGKQISRTIPIISIEGGVGVGKSTIIEYLSKLDTLITITEPEWERELKRYIEDKKKHSLWFQTKIVIPRIKLALLDGIQRSSTNPRIRAIIMERSIRSGYGFAERDKDQGYMTDKQWIEFQEIFTKALEETQQPDKVILIQSTPEKASERIKERDHCDKNFYTMEHLKEIAMYQQKIFQESIVIRNTNISLEDFKTQTQNSINEVIDSFQPETKELIKPLDDKECRENKKTKKLKIKQERKKNEKMVALCQECKIQKFYTTNERHENRQEARARRKCKLCELCWEIIPTNIKKTMLCKKDPTT